MKIYFRVKDKQIRRLSYQNPENEIGSAMKPKLLVAPPEAKIFLWEKNASVVDPANQLKLLLLIKYMTEISKL